MYKTISIKGRRYKVDLMKMGRAVGTAVTFICWMIGWGAFFMVVWGRVLG